MGAERSVRSVRRCGALWCGVGWRDRLPRLHGSRENDQPPAYNVVDKEMGKQQRQQWGRGDRRKKAGVDTRLLLLLLVRHLVVS